MDSFIANQLILQMYLQQVFVDHGQRHLSLSTLGRFD